MPARAFPCPRRGAIRFIFKNVYKGIAAMFNLYSALDCGNVEISDGVDLHLLSGIAALGQP